MVTVVVGSAMDIVTHCRVPRYLHTDLPLGNPLGPPGDHAGHRQSIMGALKLATDATGPQVKVSGLNWPGDPDWKTVYGRVDDSNREALMQAGEENRRRRAEDKARGLAR